MCNCRYICGAFAAFLLATAVFATEELKVDYYSNLIRQQLDLARRYQPPVNAQRYRSAPHYTDFGRYDYIVVGGGTTGSVVASRLSDMRNKEILLLEAGNFANDFVEIPLMTFPSQLTDYNWGYTSVPQNMSCLGMIDKSCVYPSGRGIGGTTLINELLYARGNRYDFDSWAAHGNPVWAWDEVKPFLRRSENFKGEEFDRRYHGRGGRWSVEYTKPASLQLHAFIEANLELGEDEVDYNGESQLGVSRIQQNTENGTRSTAGNAFLYPVLRRKNLKVSTESYVTKVLIDEQTSRAYGVEFSHNGRRFVASARSEVILSAGTIGSAFILQHSGIGPKEFLAPHGIPCIKDLAVGQHLQDHPTFLGLVFDTNYTEPTRTLEDYVYEYLDGVGAFTKPANLQGVAFYKTHLASHPRVPNLELLMYPANASSEFAAKALRLSPENVVALFGSSNPTSAFLILPVVLNAISEGTVRIKSADPFEYPDIDGNFLSDSYNHDIDVLYEGIQMAFRLINTTAFRKINATYAARPLPACSQFPFLSRDYWYCALRQVSFHLSHHVGTCKMGPSPETGNVVDQQLRVHGIRDLRVADASVIPFSMSAHPASTCVLIGEIVSDMIKRRTTYPIQLLFQNTISVFRRPYNNVYFLNEKDYYLYNKDPPPV